MVELDALGVDPYEDVRNLLLAGSRSQLDDLEPEVPEVAYPVYSLFKAVLFGSVQCRASALG